MTLQTSHTITSLCLSNSPQNRYCPGLMHLSQLLLSIFLFAPLVFSIPIQNPPLYPPEPPRHDQTLRLQDLSDTSPVHGSQQNTTSHIFLVDNPCPKDITGQHSHPLLGRWNSYSKPRVAVCVYGLIPRSLHHTYRSIQKNVIGSLEQEGYDVDLFGHTYHAFKLSNQRSHEQGIDLSDDSLHLLNYTRLARHRQSSIDPILNFRLYESFGSAWQDEGPGFSSLHNLLRQLYSLERSWTIMYDYAVSCGIRYHAVILLRPDCFYESPISLRGLLIHPYLVHLPNYTETQSYNDRFSISSMEGSGIMARRIHSAYSFCTANNGRRPLHSESLVFFHLTTNNIAVRFYRIQYCRVRANGGTEIDGCSVDALNKLRLGNFEV